MKIKLEGGKVKYFANDAQLGYESTVDPSFGDLLVDFSLHSNGSQIIDLTLNKACEQNQTPSICEENYTIEDQVNIIIDGNTITKQGGHNSQFDAGGATNIRLADGDFITYSVMEGRHTIIGLSDSNSDASWDKINYAFYVNANKKLIIYESGVKVAEDLGEYTAGTELKIKLEGGKVKYFADDVQLDYESSVDPSFSDLLVDFSLHSNGSQIMNLNIISDCNNTSRIKNNPDQVSSQEISLAQTKLFPNPANEQFNIQFSKDISFPVQMQLLSITGQQIMTTQLNQYTNTIQSKDIAKGIYLIRLQHNENSHQIKLAIQ